MKVKFSNVLQRLIQTIFCSASFGLVSYVGVMYVCGLIKVIKLCNFGGSGSIGSEEQKVKVLSIIGLITASIVVLAVLVLLTKYLIKFCIRYFKPTISDNIEYFVVERRWFDAFLTMVIGFCVMFLIKYLFNYATSWNHSIFCYIDGGLFLFVALIIFIFWLYYKIWLAKIPKTKKEEIFNIITEVREKRVEKLNIKKEQKNSDETKI